MVEMTTQLPTARHQSASRRTGSNLHQVNRDTAPQRHPDHSASQVSRTDAYQVNPSLLAGILLISPLRKLRNSSKNESQRRAAQNGCSLAGSLSSTRDCVGLGRVGNCAICAIHPKTKSNGHDEGSRRWADGSEQLKLSATWQPECERWGYLWGYKDNALFCFVIKNNGLSS